MALVYDKLKGSFKEGKPTDEQTNQSGIMAKELSSLSGAGPEGHTLAYVTPEEEKLLRKATGKESIMTAYGIPTYQTDLTAEEMEENLIKGNYPEEMRENIDEIKKKAMNLAKEQNRKSISKAGQEGILSPQETDEKLTESLEDDYNIIYKMLLAEEYEKLNEQTKMFYGAGDLIKRGVDKVKSLMSSDKKEVTGPEPKNLEPLTKDYHLNKFLEEQQQLMQSKEPYFPPQP